MTLESATAAHTGGDLVQQYAESAGHRRSVILRCQLCDLYQQTPAHTLLAAYVTADIAHRVLAYEGTFSA